MSSLKSHFNHIESNSVFLYFGGTKDDFMLVELTIIDKRR